MVVVRRFAALVLGAAILPGCSSPATPSPGAPPAPSASGSAVASVASAMPIAVRSERDEAPPAPPCREPGPEPLPPGAIARMGSSLVPHGAFVRVAFHPDGERLVSGGFYGEVNLWNARQARVTALLGSPPSDDEDLGGMSDVAVERGGRFAVVAGYKALVFYGISGERAPEPVRVSGERVTSMAVASDADVGVYARCVERGDTVGTFDTRRGRLLETYPGHQAESGESCSHEVAISADGELIAADADRDVVLLRRRDGERLGRIRVGGVAVQSLAFSSDGSRLVVATTDEALNVFDTKTLRAVRSFGWVTRSTSASWLQGASLSPSGALVAAEAHGLVRIWDYQTQSEVARYGRVEGHDAAPVWSPDGSLLAYPSSDPDTVVVMDVSAGRRLGVADLCRHDRELKSMVLSDDDKLLATVSADDTVRLWETEGGRALARIDRADAAAFSRDGSLLAVAGPECVLRVYRTLDGARVVGKEPGAGWLGDVCFPVGLARSPKADVVALTDNRGTLRLMSLRDGKELARRALLDEASTSSLSAPAWSPDGTRIAVGRDDGISLFDAGAEPVGSLPTKERDRVYAVDYAPDGKLVAAQHYDEVLLLAPDGTVRQRFALSRFQGLAFLPGDRLLVGRDNGLVVTLDGTSERELDDRELVRVVTSSRDGKILATAAQGVVLVWRMP